MPDPPPKRRGRPPSGGREAIIAATLQLLRERGIGRLTTREVAQLAGVSEASVFYHYVDRAGLLKAAFEAGVRPLQEIGEAGLSGERRAVLTGVGRTLERFLDEVLPVITASQSDVELRDALGAYMHEHNLGPHRGVQTLGAYLAAEQAAGHIRPDIDPYAVALTFAGACLTRAWQRQMPVGKAPLPSLEEVVDALDALLDPPAMEPGGCPGIT